MSVPLYVAETPRQAREEAEASTMHFFRSISKALKKSDGATAQTAEARAARANRLSEITYDEVLSEYAVVGSPEAALRAARGDGVLDDLDVDEPGRTDPERARAEVDAAVRRARRAASRLAFT